MLIVLFCHLHLPKDVSLKVRPREWCYFNLVGQNGEQDDRFELRTFHFKAFSISVCGDGNVTKIS